VRYRLMATYQGSPFEAGIGPTDADIVLFAACPPPEELGFEPATGHWRKQLNLADVQAVWESRPVGSFRAERCMVLDDLGDQLHIGYLGHDGFKAKQLGYWQVDRGVFELVVPRTEVTDILEERVDYTRPDPSSSGQHPTPAAPARPDPRSSGQYATPASPTSAQYATPASATSGQYATPASPTSGQYATPASPTSGQYQVPASYATAGPGRSSTYAPVPDSSTGVALPTAAQAPLPLEAEAMRAASEARRPGPRPSAAPVTASVTPPAAVPEPPAQPSAAQPSPVQPSPAPVQTRRATRRRMATERLFADLAALAGIPAEAYSVGELVDGALCLVQSTDGFEVFHASGGARHELQVFASEEAACFYLFGVLAAEAVRNGSLTRPPVPAGLGAGRPRSA
jgi:hypothetical protein